MCNACTTPDTPAAPVRRKIDITKPVRTRDGQPVTLVTDKARSVLLSTSGTEYHQPLGGYIGDSTKLEFWCADGSFGPPGYEAGRDLVQNVVVYQLMWLGSDGPHITSNFGSRESALMHLNRHRGSAGNRLLRTELDPVAMEVLSSKVERL